jgi:hypothetical protein
VAKSQTIPTPKFDTVALYIVNGDSNVPVVGNSHYIVINKSASRIQLFHPFTFTKFSMAEPEFRAAQLPCEWNNKPQIANWLERQACKWASMHRQAPFKLIREIIAEYRPCALAAVVDFHGAEVE